MKPRPWFHPAWKLTASLVILAGLLFSPGQPAAHALAPSNPVVWNAFLGGLGDDTASGLVRASDGSLFVCGTSDSTWGAPWRAYSTGQDVFVARLQRDGSLAWNTFLGGIGTDRATGISLLPDGSLVVSGSSDVGWGWPLRPYTAGQDGFIARLDSNGSLLWHTFLGGAGTDEAGAVAADASGNIYASGASDSSWQGLIPPVRPYTASMDAFTARLNPDGTLVWNTFLGGLGVDAGTGIVVNSSGNPLVVGTSASAWQGLTPPLRSYSAGTDGFAALLDSAGGLASLAFLGGSGDDSIASVTLNAAGNPLLAGSSTASWGAPLRAYTAMTDGFALQLDVGGGLTWNTFLGGTSNDYANGIAVDTSGRIHITGASHSSWGTPVHPYTAGSDAFAARLGAAGTLQAATFFGAAGNETGSALSVDTGGTTFIAGTSADDWQGSSPPTRPWSNGNDGFVARVDITPPTVLSVTGIPQGGYGILDEDEAITVNLTGLIVQFSEDLFNPAGDNDPDDVTNAFNYLLVQPGENGYFETNDCLAGTGGDDLITLIWPVTYQNHDGLGPFEATLNASLLGPMQVGTYRLFVCGTSSLFDLAGEPLGGGTDFLRNFSIVPFPRQIPETGFPPAVVTRLKPLSPESGYTHPSGLWLEIPSLAIQAPIWGVPLTRTGWDTTWLGDNLGWLEGSTYPGLPGNAVLTGHVFNHLGQPGPLVNLSRMQYAEQIILHAGDQVATYSVRSNRLVAPSDVRLLRQTESVSWLTIITCEGYDPASGEYSFRRLVRAVMVDG